MDWKNFIGNESKKEYFKNILLFLENERQQKIIFPKQELIYNAFEQTSLEDLKIVILGQDPYHNETQAMGLAFSTP